MEKYKVVGIDLSNNVFQVCGLNQAGKVVFNRKITRAKFAAFIQQLAPTILAMESCGTANYWARRFESLGHEIRIIPAQHVKPFIRGNKNDANDALAICEAALRPDIHPVPIKTQGHQDLQMLHRMRQRHIRNATAVANQARALLRENGLIVSKSVDKLLKAIPGLLEDGDNGLSSLGRHLLHALQQELHYERQCVDEFERLLKAQLKNIEAYALLMTIPGYGPIISSALWAAVGNASQFKRSRQLSAWLGLTPRHVGTAGKITMLDTSKKGDRYLRALLIHGARTVVQWCKTKDDALSRWIKQIIARRGKNKAVVALANKCARIAWVVLTRGEAYRASVITPSV